MRRAGGRLAAASLSPLSPLPAFCPTLSPVARLRVRGAGHRASAGVGGPTSAYVPTGGARPPPVLCTSGPPVAGRHGRSTMSTTDAAIVGTGPGGSPPR
ncbi:hypothetical protein NKH77_18450 [Streptomyces sp. M19]